MLCGVVEGQLLQRKKHSNLLTKDNHPCRRRTSESQSGYCAGILRFTLPPQVLLPSSFCFTPTRNLDLCLPVLPPAAPAAAFSPFFVFIQPQSKNAFNALGPPILRRDRRSEIGDRPSLIISPASSALFEARSWLRTAHSLIMFSLTRRSSSAVHVSFRWYIPPAQIRYASCICSYEFVLLSALVPTNCPAVRYGLTGYNTPTAVA